MKIVSINISKPIEVEHNGEKVSTGIFKSPVAGSIAVHRNNLEGDGQADLTVHGGQDKAVYAYSLDHYPHWQRALGRDSFPFGQFGENLTIAGLDETSVFIGDHWQVGSALFAITQPRQPCYKLGIRFGDDTMPRQFAKSGLTGVYLRVLKEGQIAVNDEVQVLKRGVGSVSVLELFRAYTSPAQSEAKSIYRRALAVEELAESWREEIERRLRR